MESDGKMQSSAAHLKVIVTLNDTRFQTKKKKTIPKKLLLIEIGEARYTNLKEPQRTGENVRTTHANIKNWLNNQWYIIDDTI